MSESIKTDATPWISRAADDRAAGRVDQLCKDGQPVSRSGGVPR
ncbi:hypothetical protein P3T39_003471 [Kitasatospora sp. GP82]|nr:hypothetical protein [Kitasatospora sp. GP82]